MKSSGYHQPALRIRVLPGRFAVCRLDAAAPLPGWLPESGVLTAIARTEDELSIVCDQRSVPDAVRAERDYVALGVSGPLDFETPGIMASLSGALAGAGIPLLAISTFDTDYLLVRAARLDDAVRALRAGRHEIAQ